MQKRLKNNGWLLTEIAVVISLLGIFFMLIATSIDTFRHFNRIQLLKQQCIAAGQAQLDSFTATGKTISKEDTKRLWPNVDITIEQQDGRDQWKGLMLVQVTSKAKAKQREIEIKLSRYILINQEQQ